VLGCCRRAKGSLAADLAARRRLDRSQCRRRTLLIVGLGIGLLEVDRGRSRRAAPDRHVARRLQPCSGLGHPGSWADIGLVLPRLGHRKTCRAQRTAGTGARHRHKRVPAGVNETPLRKGRCPLPHGNSNHDSTSHCGRGIAELGHSRASHQVCISRRQHAPELPRGLCVSANMGDLLMPPDKPSSTCVPASTAAKPGFYEDLGIWRNQPGFLVMRFLPVARRTNQSEPCQPLLHVFRGRGLERPSTRHIPAGSRI